MSYEATRAAVVAAIQTGWNASSLASTLIEFENLTLIDHDQQKLPFVTCEMRWRDAKQAAIFPVVKRLWGELWFHLHVKDGDGSKLSLQMADVLDGLLRFQKVSGVQMLAPKLGAAGDFKGWRIWPFSVPFWYDD